MLRLPGKRKNKYGAKKTPFAGRTFDSGKEAKRYAELLLLQQAGHIAELECQPVYAIIINDQLICRVIPDFRYLDIATGKRIVEDVKSPPTRKNKEFRLKQKLLLAMHGVEPVLL